MIDKELVVPISALEHHLYCPRQCALIHVDGVWTESANTQRGAIGHQRADSGAHRTERGRRVLRSIPLWSESLGLTGRADAVEIDQEGALTPVEYKIGRRHGLAAHVQLCAQALCLEEMTGRSVTHGAIWFSSLRRRDEVQLDADLRAMTLRAIAEVRTNLTSPSLPDAPNDARCGECQLLGHCLPSVVADPGRLIRFIDEVVFKCG